MSEEALQIAVKRREVKGKGEKERYTHLNAESQRTARRDKKAFLSDQCKEIEENKRMGKTRDLCKKIKDTKGTFHGKMGTIKEKNRMGNTRDFFKKIRDTKGTFHAKMGTIIDITECSVWTLQKQKILIRGGKNTQKNYRKKIFMTQITTMM